MGQDCRDEEIAATKNRVLARKAIKRNGWTKARRAAFLTELAQSCNVTRAVAAAGLAAASAYRLRHRDTGFAEAWRAALALGYERLEMALVRRALEVVDDLVLDDAVLDDAAGAAELVGRMTVAQAMDVMARHRTSVMGTRRGDRRQTRHVATQEETDAVLLKRIEMVWKQRAREAARNGVVPEGGGAQPDPRGGD